MQTLRLSDIDRMMRQLEDIKLKNFDPIAAVGRVPSQAEFAEAVVGGPLDPWQHDYVANAPSASRIAIAASRQSGKSTVTAGFVAHCLIFIPNFMCLVASRSLRQASHYLNKVREAVLTIIPRDAMRQLNRLSMELPNGSSVVSIPCAQPDAGRGFSPHLVILDEAAFAPEELFRAITPSLAATQGALHMLSSPNGRQGYFFEAFEGAAKSVFWNQRVHWKDCPRITQEIADMERIALGSLYFKQEFEAEFVSPLGAFFGYSAVKQFEHGESEDLSSLDLSDMEVLLDERYPGNDPDVEDLQEALSRTDRVTNLLYG
jgi:hypothetical protein